MNNQAEDCAQIDNSGSPYQTLIDQLNMSVDRVLFVTNAIENIDRRLHGNYPEPPHAGTENAKVASEPNGYLETMANRMQNLLDAVNAAESAINKLDNRVAI